MIVKASVGNFAQTRIDKTPAFRRSRLAAAVGITGVLLAAGMNGSVFAAKDGLCKDGTPRPCKPSSTGEEGAGNNLSFPLILSDNVSPGGFPQEGPWRFEDISEPETQCIGEEGVADGSAVPPEYVCYYGRHVTVSSDEGSVGEIIFDGDPKFWWLQKRSQNFWRAMSTGHDITTPLVVSAVDVGDLLESTPAIQARQIRVEFNLLQDASQHDDQEFGGFVVPDWNAPVPFPCTVPDETGESVGCFAALGMSGAVPGTEQSGNEMQGTDFGPDVGATEEGTQTLLDPTMVRKAVYNDGTNDVEIPIHALVYSHCARLVIQKIDGTPVWDAATGQWAGPGVGAPVVNVATYSGWSVEITSSGSIVYGYNWNAKTAATGAYRLTFVLDGNDAEGPQCPTARGTTFGSDGVATTELVNIGENNLPVLIREGDYPLNESDEGGLVYLDLNLTTKGGGGGKSGGGGGKP